MLRHSGPFKLRPVFTGAAVLLGVSVLAYVFSRPQPVLVTLEALQKRPFKEVFTEQGRTTLSQRYTLLAPMDGYLERIHWLQGAQVTPQTLLFRLRPLTSPLLNARGYQQALEQEARNRAQWRMAQQTALAAQVDFKRAQQQWLRIQDLHHKGFAALDALEQADTQRQQAAAQQRAADYAVAMAQHEWRSAQAVLAAEAQPATGAPVAVYAPIKGQVLKRYRYDEGAVSLGAPLLELGDLTQMEVEVDVLTPSASRLTLGTPAEINAYCGQTSLPARIRHIEPQGFTRYSALGIEEQRVWVKLALLTPPHTCEALGDGYRVEVTFILRQHPQLLQVPLAAVVYPQQHPCVFVFKQGRAVLRSVQLGGASGDYQEVLAGLAVGEQVVVYPPEVLTDGARVEAINGREERP